MTNTLPDKPMSPIVTDTLPVGRDWGYQIKWDGVRLLASVQHGDVQLYSKRMLIKNAVFPEIVRLLGEREETMLLDGEAIMFDNVEQRPDFAKVLQREKVGMPTRTDAANRYTLCYVLFDLLHEGGRDLRDMPYASRHARLCELFPDRMPTLFVADLIADGEALWQWVQARNWEGVVSKKLSSRYANGKRHQDWFKKKTSVTLAADIVGLTIREGRVASLVLSRNGEYFGRVSLGLNDLLKRKLVELAQLRSAAQAQWVPLPEDLRRESVRWIQPPLTCVVTGLSITPAGVLRHPKILSLKLPD